MTDYSELKRLAEAAKDDPESPYIPCQVAFNDTANPAAVLKLIAENEALRRDAERYRWLREQEAESGVAILPIGVWVKPAMLTCTPFDSAEMADSVIDSAMAKEMKP